MKRLELDAVSALEGADTYVEESSAVDGLHFDRVSLRSGGSPTLRDSSIVAASKNYIAHPLVRAQR